MLVDVAAAVGPGRHQLRQGCMIRSMTAIPAACGICMMSCKFLEAIQQITGEPLSYTHQAAWLCSAILGVTAPRSKRG